jgi:hypothetical protein
MKYRAMDDLCLSIRTFRQCNSNFPKENSTSPDLSDFIETTEECVINELIITLETELENGLQNEAVRKVLRKSGDAVRMAPLARANHFFYGVLDLIQQHIQTIDSGKINNKVVNLAFKVAQDAPHSYLRCKAFEILASMSSKCDVGQMPIEKVNKLLRNNNWDEKKREKFRNQWAAMRKRAVDVEMFLGEIRTSLPNPTQVDR